MATPIKVNEATLAAAPGEINFADRAVGSVNPAYVAGGGFLFTSVSFGGYFVGQNQTGCLVSNPGCVNGTPSAGLALDSASPKVRTSQDPQSGSNPVLGSFNDRAGPVAVLFGQDVIGFSLKLGYDNGFNDIRVQAFGNDGVMLGQWDNFAQGFTTLTVADDQRKAQIRGLLISNPQFLDEFGIDNLKVAGAAAPSVPEPTPLALLGLAAFGLGLVRRRR